MGVSHRRVSGTRIEVDTDARPVLDDLAVEEPLEIRVGDGQSVLRSFVTMRTPGADFDLAAGWLRGEGVLRSTDDLLTIRACTDPTLAPAIRANVVTVDLAAAAVSRVLDLARSSQITSACGVCGADTLNDVLTRHLPLLSVDSPVISPGVLLQLAESLAAAQRGFARTGGLHGAGAASVAGDLLAVREDVGRHNAVDKVLGWALLSGARPDAVVVSSRASFEIVQKAASAGVPIVVTMSAPSTLAVDLAERAGITLAAFARDGRATLYAHPQRVSD